MRKEGIQETMKLEGWQEYYCSALMWKQNWWWKYGQKNVGNGDIEETIDRQTLVVTEI